MTHKTTQDLVNEGELLDLKKIDIDDSPRNPYGKHLGTSSVSMDRFESGTFVAVYENGTLVSSQFVKNRS